MGAFDDYYEIEFLVVVTFVVTLSISIVPCDEKDSSRFTVRVKWKVLICSVLKGYFVLSRVV